MPSLLCCLRVSLIHGGRRLMPSLTTISVAKVRMGKVSGQQLYLLVAKDLLSNLFPEYATGRGYSC